MNKVLLTFLLLIGSMSGLKAQDSAIYVVLNTLSAEAISVNEPVKDLLISAEWEALATWEKTAPKEIAYLQEAVGDLYTFRDDLTFLIKLIDAQDPTQFGLKINGKYSIENNIIQMVSDKGRTMKAEIRYLDKNYLVLEIDGLRIFYTKSRSYFSYD